MPSGHRKYTLNAQLKKPVQPHGASAKRPGPLPLQKTTAAASREALSHDPVGIGGGRLLDEGNDGGGINDGNDGGR